MPAAQLLTVAALAAAVLALVLAAVLARRLTLLERAHATLAPDGFLATARRAAAVRRDLDVLGREVARARSEVATALRHVAVVRYDAFDDLAGRLSFSAALLDDAGDGVVLTSINGRSETRTYAKGVSGGTSSHPLSPEEREAVLKAASPRPAPVLEQAG